MPGNDHIERQALDLVERAFDHPSHEREEWLRAQTVSDPDVLSRALSILAADSPNDR